MKEKHRYAMLFSFIYAFCYFQTEPLGVSHTPSGNPTAQFETSEKFFLIPYTLYFINYLCYNNATTQIEYKLILFMGKFTFLFLVKMYALFLYAFPYRYKSANQFVW